MDYYIYNGQFYSTDELYHYGILGMKWGVRRYQNKDGTLTKAGKKRQKLRDSNLATDRPTEMARRGSLNKNDTISELRTIVRGATTEDFDERKPECKAYLDMDEEIRKYSGDYYEGKGITKAFSDAVDKHEKLNSEIENTYGRKQHDRFKEYSNLKDTIAFDHMSQINKESITKYDSVSDFDDFDSAYRKAIIDPRVVKAYDTYREASKECSKASAIEMNRYRDELSGVILKDLGYKDTPETRSLITEAFLYH